MDNLTVIIPRGYENIPNHTFDSINSYVYGKIPPGDFLYAVLCNNLKESIMHADDKNIRALPDIVKYLYNKCPAICWGNEEKVANWLDNNAIT